MKGPYDDILYVPHHVSSSHPQMPVEDRAAQFAPFAALSGYDEAVKETARLTDEQTELSEDVIERLDMKLKILEEHSQRKAEVSITYFLPDERKSGGAYALASGQIKRVDAYDRRVVLMDGTSIRINSICDIEGEIIDRYFTDMR